MALLLCIETSTKACSTALYEGGILLGQKYLLTDEFVHSENLNPFILRLLEETSRKFKDLQAVAVSRGPGSYTGLRIGVSTAKGICYALDIPLIAVETLELMAMGAREKEIHVADDHFLCPMLDARRMEVYSAVYSGDLQIIAKPEPKILDEFSYHDYLAVNTCWFFGDGSEKFRSMEGLHPNAKFISNIYPSAKTMITSALKKFNEKEFENLAYFEPEYLKEFYTPPKKTD